MYKIVRKEKLSDKIYLMDVEAPRVAKHCQPGQFVIVKLDENPNLLDTSNTDWVVSIIFADCIRLLLR